MIHAVLLPASTRDALEDDDHASEKMLLSTTTDITLDGHRLQRWLIASDQAISVLSDNCSETPHGSKLLRRIRWDEIQGIRTVAGVGSGRLQIRQDDTWMDVLRYSNALGQRFHKVSRQLEKGIGASESDLPRLLSGISTELDPPRCQQCDLRLPKSVDPEDAHCPRCMQRGRIFKRVWELVAPYRQGVLFLCLLTIFGVAAELVPPKLQQYMVDQILTRDGQPLGASAAGENFHTALLVVVLSLAASRIMLSAVAFVKGRVATRIGVGLTGRIRDELVTKLHTLSIAYYDRHNTGSIISRVSHDSEALHGLVHQFTGGFLLQIVKLFGVGIMLMLINPKLAMFTLIPVPLVFLGSWVFWNRVYPRYYRLRDASAKQMSALNGMLNGIRVVKAFGQEDREFERFHRSRENLTKWRLWVDITNSGYAASMQIVFSMGGLIVWYVGGLDVIGSEMTLGELIAFLAYLAMFYAPLNALSSFTTWMTSFLSGSKRVLELLDTPTAIGESKQAVPLHNTKGDLRFESVTFGYDPNQPVLKDVSFQVKPGEMIGIVGRSGSGKTTIVNLLTRFYDVQEGRITIDGIDVRDIASRDLRDAVGIVLQDSFLFRGTIWKNLCYGKPDVEILKALSAAKAAGAHDFICRQPLGYDTVLGQNGAGLSGGEKQRLSIARTLLYDPQVLILDEATSNIDAESEKLIQDALEELTKGRTTIAIAHRLSTLRNADRILVFDRGDLVEEGSHAELITQDGKYAKMVRIQMQVSKDPSVDALIDSAPETVREPSSVREEAVEEATSEAGSEAKAAEIRWLAPQAIRFDRDSMDRISLVIDNDELHQGVFCVRVFPARHPDQFISVRCWDSKGDETEIGMIHEIAELSEWDRGIVADALDRQCLMRKIIGVDKVSLAHGYLDLDVQTEAGPDRITMRWTASQAVDFGEDGKLIIDTEENRFCVDDVWELPKPDRERFQQYIYW